MLVFTQFDVEIVLVIQTDSQEKREVPLSHDKHEYDQKCQPISRRNPVRVGPVRGDDRGHLIHLQTGLGSLDFIRRECLKQGGKLMEDINLLSS